MLFGHLRNFSHLHRKEECTAVANSQREEVDRATARLHDCFADHQTETNPFAILLRRAEKLPKLIEDGWRI